MSVLLFALVLSVACEKDEDQAVFADDATVAVTLSDNTLVLEKDNASETALTITWEIADANVVVAPSYTVQFAYGGKTSNVSAESSPLELTTEGLNTILTNLGVLPNQATDVTVTVTGALSEYFDLESATNTLKVTTYEDVLDLSTAWGVVGSITNWGGSPDVPFWKVVGDDSSYVAYVTVVGSGQEIKFRKTAIRPKITEMMVQMVHLKQERQISQSMPESTVFFGISPIILIKSKNTLGASSAMELTVGAIRTIFR